MGFMSTLHDLKHDLFSSYEMMLAPVHHGGAVNDGFIGNFSMMITYAKMTSVIERSSEFSLVLGMLLCSIFDVVRPPARVESGQVQQHNASLHDAQPAVVPKLPSLSSITYLSQDGDQVAKIFPNGDVGTMLYAEITYSCAFDSSLFPFDVQSCGLCFALNGYDPDDFRFSATIAPGALATDMSEWRVHIDNVTDSFDYCASNVCINILHYSIILARNPQFWIGLVIVPIFMLGVLILIGLFFSGPQNIVHNAIGFGLTTMMSMMVVVGILNSSLSKIESIPCLVCNPIPPSLHFAHSLIGLRSLLSIPQIALKYRPSGLFVLVQISITSTAVIVVMVAAKLRRSLTEESSNKVHDSSQTWKLVGSITRSERLVRNVLFVIFAGLHIGNLVWLLSKQDNSQANAAAFFKAVAPSSTPPPPI